MNWFAIGGGLACALAGASAELARLSGRTTALPRTPAIVLIVLGLVFAFLGARPAF